MISQACYFSDFRSFANVALRQLARWLLVVLLVVFVVDLVSSPFHGHHHIGGPDGYLNHLADDSHFVSAAVADHENHSRHSEDTDHSGGHEISALQFTPMQLSKPESVAKALAFVPLFIFFGLLTQPTAERVVRWRSGRNSVPIPLFRTVPPDGRAPPSLHA